LPGVGVHGVTRPTNVCHLDDPTKKSDLRFPLLRLKTEKSDLKSPFFRQKRRSRTQERRSWSKNGKVGSEIVVFPPKTTKSDLESPFLRQKRRSWTWKRRFSTKNGEVGLEIAVFGPKTAILTGKMAFPDRIISFNRLKIGSLGWEWQF
jgi:hypothetical protein